MKQLFIAIKVKPNFNTLNVYNHLRRVLNYNSINWVEPDRFHLTIKYLGSINESTISGITNVMRETFEAADIINIELNKVRIFGSRYNPRVIWFGIEQNLKLEKLAQNLFNNLETIGFSKDRQNFVPHISIGRINKIIDKKLFNDSIDVVKNVFLQKLAVDKLILFESILTDGGFKYNEIFSMHLSGEKKDL